MYSNICQCVPVHFPLCSHKFNYGFSAMFNSSVFTISNFALCVLLLLPSASLTTILFLLCMASARARKEHATVPTHLPWTGRHNQLFASIRANYRGLVNSVQLFRSGYREVSSNYFLPGLTYFSLVVSLQQYSKEGQTYVVPTWTKGPQTILPPKYGNWIACQPDALLNAKDCTFDTGPC